MSMKGKLVDKKSHPHSNVRMASIRGDRKDYIFCPIYQT